jgi:hypothetical protein
MILIRCKGMSERMIDGPRKKEWENRKRRIGKGLTSGNCTKAKPD